MQNVADRGGVKNEMGGKKGEKGENSVDRHRATINGRFPSPFSLFYFFFFLFYRSFTVIGGKADSTLH